MPWKECKPMDERLKLIARLLEGEKMARVCREFASGVIAVAGIPRRPPATARIFRSLASPAHWHG